MFPAGTAKTRPEIYAMGFRNPFRIGIDPTTNHLFVADYGPDAGQVSPTRGPDGRVEWDILDKPGFYGWPYCVGDNTPYNDSRLRDRYRRARPSTATHRSTTRRTTPVSLSCRRQSRPSLWMGKSTTGVPEIGGSGAPMTQWAYKFDPDSDSDRKWPEYFDGKAVFADWNDSRLFSVQLNDDRTGVADVSRMLAEAGLHPAARAAVRTGRCAVRDRVGEWVRRQQCRLGRLPDRLRARQSGADRPVHDGQDVRAGTADSRLRLAPGRAIRTGSRSRWRGTSTATVRRTAPTPSRRTPTPRPASSRHG